MARAAKSADLKAAFERHTEETRGHVERLQQAFELLGVKAKAKPCKGMQGLVEEGQEKISEGKEKEDVAADLGLVAAAQKVEHYEISGYGTVKVLARQIGAIDVATLLAHTLGEEESADFLLTDISKPLMQQATLDDTPAVKVASRSKKS